MSETAGKRYRDDSVVERSARKFAENRQIPAGQKQELASDGGAPNGLGNGQHFSRSLSAKLNESDWPVSAESKRARFR
jgi:hypothetical protein